jgi:hypothetical protein
MPNYQHRWSIGTVFGEITLSTDNPFQEEENSTEKLPYRLSFRASVEGYRRS